MLHDMPMHMPMLMHMSCFHAHTHTHIGLYDEVGIEDMEWDGEKEMYTYPCPCGDKFVISKVRGGGDAMLLAPSHVGTRHDGCCDQQCDVMGCDVMGCDVM